jgi:hypothetical protein
MLLGKTGQRSVIVLSYLVTFHVLLAYGFPGAVFVLLAIGMGILYARTRAEGAAAISISLVVATLLYSLALKVTGFGDAIYYRPDEILSEYRDDLGHHAYRRGETKRMHMPHGDLQPMTRTRIGVARDVEYHIDHYGFRNDADYAGEPYVLVGDSFIVGTGNTQTDLLSAQLKHDLGWPVQQHIRRARGLCRICEVFSETTAVSVSCLYSRK